jgi:hypothetical protein
MKSLRRGLEARNKDFLTSGAPNKDHAMQALLLVEAALPGEEGLRESRSADALDALGRLVSEQARRGGSPLGPRAWGQFLAHVIKQGDR